jgi:hypothetical protein
MERIRWIGTNYLNWNWNGLDELELELDWITFRLHELDWNWHGLHELELELLEKIWIKSDFWIGWQKQISSVFPLASGLIKLEKFSKTCLLIQFNNRCRCSIRKNWNKTSQAVATPTSAVIDQYKCKLFFLTIIC